MTGMKRAIGLGCMLAFAGCAITPAPSSPDGYIGGGAGDLRVLLDDRCPQAAPPPVMPDRGSPDAGAGPEDYSLPGLALSMISKKFLNQPKQQVNNRIVVVGASDTGISTIESLINIKNLNFTNLTLLAPGGLITMNTENQYDVPFLRR